MTTLPFFSPFKLYRLTRPQYANLSGIGAAMHHGRWNEVGQEALYTSCEAACTVLELLAHTPKDTIPAKMAIMTIRISGEWSADGNSLRESRTAGRITTLSTLPEAYRYFNSDSFSAERPFAVAVPSVVSPSWNVVLYPANRGFWEHVKLESIEPFEFDPRLFPEDALLEDAL